MLSIMQLPHKNPTYLLVLLDLWFAKYLFIMPNIILKCQSGIIQILYLLSVMPYSGVSITLSVRNFVHLTI